MGILRQVLSERTILRVNDIHSEVTVVDTTNQSETKALAAKTKNRDRSSASEQCLYMSVY